MYFYEVAPSKIFRNNSQILTYAYPQKIDIGTIVIVPIGAKTFPGIVIKKVPKPNFKTKQIAKILYSRPLPKHLFTALFWLQAYYATPLASILQTILPKGINKKRREKTAAQVNTISSKKLQLNNHQKTAIKQINACSSNTILLHGITGSGKTNIYIELTRQIQKQNQSVIILVPEIALTSQLIDEFQDYFQNAIVLHSKQSEAERHLIWESIHQSDNPQIIIGPRSALFAPVKTLGLIIIDEAHEPAYYQDQRPKYSALRLASTMSKVILGTATPNISDYFLSTQKNAIVALDQLAISNKKQSSTFIIDLKNRQKFKKHRLFSDSLLVSIQSSLEKQTQSLIFHNRRGSAPLTICMKCGWQALCPHCLLPLILHNDHFRLLCHSCGFSTTVPTACPNCHNAEIIHKGFGTKHIEAELSKLFPNANIARFDADTPSAKSLQSSFQNLKSGHIDIIIGTQMIAKGFDFPKLTTLGIIQADSQLSLPDFSSEERSFQLLTQVIGRAKRGHQDSKIFIQSYQPEHPSIQFGASSNYSAFYNYALPLRQKTNFPPFTFLLKIQLIYKTEAIVIKNITKLQQQLSQKFPKICISRPIPSFHEHNRQGYCWQIIIKSKSRKKLLEVLSILPQNPHIRTHIDPLTLL